MKPLAKNVPGKSEWLFGDDLNKRINALSSTNTAFTAGIAHITCMISIRIAKQVAINNTKVQKTLKLPGGVLLKGRGSQSRATGFTETRQCK